MGNQATLLSENNKDESCVEYLKSDSIPIPLLLPEQHYEWTENILGMGELSVVHSAKFSQTGRRVAIKRISPNQLNHKRVKRIYKEASILNKIANIDSSSNKFVKLVEGFIDHQGGICIVTDRISGYELYNLMEKHPNGLVEEKAKVFIKQILEAVNQLHSNNIAHLDLKLENIMYNTDTNNISIIDFGFAEETVRIDVETGKTVQRLLNNFCGSAEYTSPEILLQQEFDGRRADVWSLGVIVFAMLTGRFPFAGKNRKMLMEKIVQGKYTIPSHVSSQGASFIRRMLQKYPDNRSNVASLLKHPWLVEQPKNNN